MNLIEELKAKQAQQGLSETDFARKLGVSRAIWFLVKKGERQPGMKFLKAIAREFPELQLLVFQYMAQGDTEKEAASK